MPEEETTNQGECKLRHAEHDHNDEACGEYVYPERIQPNDS